MEYQNTTDWTWTVHFDDGGTLDEYVDGVHTHAYADIQREMDAGRQVRHMVLTPSDRPDLRPVVVALETGQRPIFFRRGHITVQGDAPNYTAHCVGLRRPGQGKRGMAYLFLMPDGAAVLTSNRNEV